MGPPGPVTGFPLPYNVAIPLHVSSNKCSSSGGHIVYMQPMVTVTLKKSEWSDITKT
jgi:hypothetical protein